MYLSCYMPVHLDLMLIPQNLKRWSKKIKITLFSLTRIIFTRLCILHFGELEQSSKLTMKTLMTFPICMIMR